MSESFNEIINRIRTAAHADGPFVTYKVLNEVCGNAGGYASAQMFDKMCDMLKEAHDRELEQAYDPQRLRGTKPNTFDGALEALKEFRWQHATNDTDAIPYINAVKEAHDRELDEARNPSHECIRQTKSEHERKLELLREYGRGRRDGVELADYQRAKAVRRLQAVELNDYEEGFALLSDVCRAIYAPENGGWTRGQVCELRDALVDLLGRKTSELEQERAEVVANLREFNSEEIEPWFEMQFWWLLAHLGIDKSAGESSSCNDIARVRDRLIHLLGGDSIYGKPRKATIGDAETESNLWDSPKTINKEDDDGLADRADSDCCDSHGTGDNRGCDTAPDVPCGNNNGAIRSITKELRDCIETATKTYDDTAWYDVDDGDEHTWCSITVAEIDGIADRIEEQFARVCQQQETVLQSTIDGMVDECESLEKERDELRRQMDQQRAMLTQQRDAARAEVIRLNNCVTELTTQRDELKKRVKGADSKGDTRKLHNLINVLQREYGIEVRWNDGMSTYWLYGTDPMDALKEKLEKAEHRCGTLRQDRDELLYKLNELDQSGATNLYKLLKHTLGEAKQLADSLRASKDTRASLTEDVREKAAEVEALRQECVMYRTMLNDAVEEYKDATDARDTWFDQFEKAFAEEIEEIDDEALAGHGLVRIELIVKELDKFVEDIRRIADNEERLHLNV